MNYHIERAGKDGLLGIEGHDLNEQEMRNILSRFSSAARTTDLAVTYFAGHGIQVNGTNYLLPIDAKLEDVGDL